MPVNNSQTDIFENTRDADHKIENLLGSKIRIKSDDLSAIDKLKRSAQQKVASGSSPKLVSDALDGSSSESDFKKKYTTFFSDKIRPPASGMDGEKESIVDQFARSDFGIKKLESGTIYDDKIVINNIENIMDEFKTMLASIKSVENINISQLRALIKSFIDQTGPNQNASLLLVNLIMAKQDDYFAVHSVNVCIFSLIIAIEVSKMMLQKITIPEIYRDYNKTRLCSLKTFSEEELIDLGVAAFIHDIYIKKRLPDIAQNKVLTFRDKLEYQRHSTESFRIAEKLGCNRDIQIAILQHHETLDGQGFPDGIHESVFNRYARIIALADHYESLSFLNPFTPALGPIGAINHILKNEKTSYDADLIISFLKATSLFPLGSFVLLNTGEIGVVFEINNETMQKPKIKILFSKNKVQVKEPITIDLNDYPELKVERAVHPREVRSVLATVRSQLNLG